MSRPPLILRPVKITTYLPEDLHAKLMLHLYSPSEQRVPKGAIQRFLVERVLDYFGAPNANVS